MRRVLPTSRTICPAAVCDCPPTINPTAAYTHVHNHAYIARWRDAMWKRLHVGFVYSENVSSRMYVCVCFHAELQVENRSINLVYVASERFHVKLIWNFMRHIFVMELTEPTHFAGFYNNIACAAWPWNAECMLKCNDNPMRCDYNCSDACRN